MKQQWCPQLSGAARGNRTAILNMFLHPPPVQSKQKKKVFANCEVAEDERSDSEEHIEDGAEFNVLPSDKDSMDSKTTLDSQ